ncbi:MAG: hypothetical protein ABSC18_05210 [Verrucomicrobiota bacterium]|jgi:hypothetical protein
MKESLTKEDVTKALASDTVKKLAETQAAHATQGAALQANLTAAEDKTHQIELRFKHAETIMEAQGIPTAAIEM